MDHRGSYASQAATATSGLRVDNIANHYCYRLDCPDVINYRIGRSGLKEVMLKKRHVLARSP